MIYFYSHSFDDKVDDTYQLDYGLFKCKKIFFCFLKKDIFDLFTWVRVVWFCKHLPFGCCSTEFKYDNFWFSAVTFKYRKSFFIIFFFLFNKHSKQRELKKNMNRNDVSSEKNKKKCKRKKIHPQFMRVVYLRLKVSKIVPRFLLNSKFGLILVAQLVLNTSKCNQNIYTQSQQMRLSKERERRKNTTNNRQICPKRQNEKYWNL